MRVVTTPGRLPSKRPPQIHPIAWIHLQARSAVKQRGISTDAGHQAWLRRVSVVFARMMREAGYQCEGEK